MTTEDTFLIGFFLGAIATLVTVGLSFWGAQR